MQLWSSARTHGALPSCKRSESACFLSCLPCTRDQNASTPHLPTQQPEACPLLFRTCTEGAAARKLLGLAGQIRLDVMVEAAQGQSQSGARRRAPQTPHRLASSIAAPGASTDCHPDRQTNTWHARQPACTGPKPSSGPPCRGSFAKPTGSRLRRGTCRAQTWCRALKCCSAAGSAPAGRMVRQAGPAKSCARPGRVGTREQLPAHVRIACRLGGSVCKLPSCALCLPPLPPCAPFWPASWTSAAPPVGSPQDRQPPRRDPRVHRWAHRWRRRCSRCWTRGGARPQPPHAPVLWRCAGTRA